MAWGSFFTAGGPGRGRARWDDGISWIVAVEETEEGAGRLGGAPRLGSSYFLWQAPQRPLAPSAVETRRKNGFALATFSMWGSWQEPHSTVAEAAAP